MSESKHSAKPSTNGYIAANVHAIAELDRLSIPYKYGSEKEVLVKCPFHKEGKEETPSCSINIKTNVFKCQTAGCTDGNKGGDIISLLARFLGVNRKVIIEDLSTRYDLEQEKTINAETVERYHSRVWKALPLLAELYARGCTDELIRYYRIGENEGRLTLPIRNEHGSFVNLLSYLPGAPGKLKMKNAKGFSKLRLTPIEQLKYNTIVICGGPLKAWVAAYHLNRYSIGAISGTAGEGNWDYEFTRLLKDKKIIVCLDIDEAGQKSANTLCLQIRGVADWIGNLVLPLDRDKYKKGDINDFIGQEKGDLKPLIDSCPEYVPTVVKEGWNDDTAPEELELDVAINADKTARRVKVSAVVGMMDTAPYIIPKDIEILCNRDAKGGICSLCSVIIQDSQTFSIPAESPTILSLVATSQENQLSVVKDAVGVPMACTVCDFQTSAYYNIEDTRISPKLDITQRNSDRVLQPAFCITANSQRGLELNGTYDFTGRMFPHPKTQLATLLISKCTPTSDALNSYSLEGIEECSLFWPREWDKESIEEKLNHIYDDLEANVTRIWMRRDWHIAVDLVYHSLLYLNFDGRKNLKGWMELLGIGDTSQGKSEVTVGSDGNGGLMKHYSLGQMVDCATASPAGLMGGCLESGKRWWVKWGILPANDRQLVVLEELKKLKHEAISALTQMRSSGRAQIQKIVRRETFARCRLIANTNPPFNNRMSQYNCGLEAIKEVIGAPEDIRRFDLCMILDGRDVNAETIAFYQRNRPIVDHTYNGEICRKLILWAWTRKQEQIFFTDNATNLILQTAVELTNTYTENIPIVDKGSMRYKLARMSAALAARLFSCSEDYECLIVDKCHVEFIREFIIRTYSAPTFGYLDYTKSSIITEEMIDADVVKTFINNTPFAVDLCNSMLATTRIDINDLCDWTAWQREDALALLSILVRKHALLREGKQYRKSAAFITMLRQMIDNGEIKNRPSHIPVKEF